MSELMLRMMKNNNTNTTITTAKTTTTTLMMKTTTASMPHSDRLTRAVNAGYSSCCNKALRARRWAARPSSVSSNNRSSECLGSPGARGIAYSVVQPRFSVPAHRFERNAVSSCARARARTLTRADPTNQPASIGACRHGPWASSRP